MTCTVCGAAAFEHHGFAGWLCPRCSDRGAEAYEAALGLNTDEQTDQRDTTAERKVQ
jgi:hypothetical protein